MGNVLSYFWRKKTSLEELQNIEETIKSIEEYHFNVQRRRKLTENFLFYAMVLLIFFGCSYLYFFPRGIKDGWVIWATLIALSILLFFLRRIVSLYFEWKIKNNRRKRNDALAAKDKIIKNVMETETYNVANTILEKYAPHLRPRLQPQAVALPDPRKIQLAPQGSQVRQRQPQKNPSGPPQPLQQYRQNPSTGPDGKSLLNRIVEHLLGDGPSNRYALICTNCHEHNGLVLPEEFLYTSFRCPKCSQFHPARKPRPSAPKLPEYTPERPVIENSDVVHEIEKIEEPLENSLTASDKPDEPADSPLVSEPDEDKE